MELAEAQVIDEIKLSNSYYQKPNGSKNILRECKYYGYEYDCPYSYKRVHYNKKPKDSLVN